MEANKWGVGGNITPNMIRTGARAGRLRQTKIRFGFGKLEYRKVFAFVFSVCKQHIFELARR